MAIPAYTVRILKSGTSTAFTNEPMTNVGTNTYQITDTTKQIWDRNVTPSFTEDDGAGGRLSIPASDVQSIDYLRGTVVFTRAVTEPIQVSGNYMPMARVAGAHEFTIDLGGNVLDATEFDDPTDPKWRKRIYGLPDATVSLTRFIDAVDDFISVMNNGSRVVIDIQFDKNTQAGIRGWFVVASDNTVSSVDDLEKAEITFNLDGDRNSALSWK